jgi:cysteine-rich repeat protein
LRRRYADRERRRAGTSDTSARQCGRLFRQVGRGRRQCEGKAGGSNAIGGSFGAGGATPDAALEAPEARPAVLVVHRERAAREREERPGAQATREAWEPGAPGGPVCGNNTIETGEECDRQHEDGDGCSSICKKKCETCEATAAGCKDLQVACYELDGVATEGPAQGVAKADLCAELMACIRKSDCAYSPADPLSGLDDGVTGCYCGDATFAECIQQGTKAPNGPCKAEVEAAAETTTPKGRRPRAESDLRARRRLQPHQVCDQDPALCLSSCLRNLAPTSDAGP